MCVDPATLPPGVARAADQRAWPPAHRGPAPGATGAPEPTRLEARIRFFCPADVVPFLRAGLDSCQGQEGLLPPWRCLEVLILGFLAEHLDTPAVKRLQAAYPTLERDGWCCQAPICSGRGPLHRHHAKPLGTGGPDVDWNITSLCGHHLVQVHTMRSLRVWGRAPDGFTWEVGCRRGRAPLLRFAGEVKINPNVSGFI